MVEDDKYNNGSDYISEFFLNIFKLDKPLTKIWSLNELVLEDF